MEIMVFLSSCGVIFTIVGATWILSNKISDNKEQSLANVLDLKHHTQKSINDAFMPLNERQIILESRVNVLEKKVG